MSHTDSPVALRLPKRIFVWVVCGAAVAMSVAAGAEASGTTSIPRSKSIAGWLERVTIPAVDQVVKAKLDSGAKTSSIWAVDVEEFSRDGEQWVRFRLLLGKGKSASTYLLERKRVRGVKIKDHDDASARRQVVELEICFDGRMHRVQFTLADRRNFLYPILLGRRFLKNAALVDSSKTYLTDSHCPAPTAGGKD